MGKKGIKNKVTNLVAVISIIAMALISVVSIVGIFSMRNSTKEISSNLGSQAATDSEQALSDLALTQLLSLTKSKTTFADQKLQAVINQAEIITAMAQDIYNNPDNYTAKDVSRPVAENAGIPTAQLLHAEEMDPAAYDEIGLIANLSEVIIQSTECNSSVITSQIGTESGFIIMGDTNSDTKADIEYLDPRTRSWYIKTKENQALSWSDVVDDAFGRGLGIVCANPVYDKNGDFRGVVGVSSLLTELSNTITNEDLGDSAYSFALNENGTMIISPKISSIADCTNMFDSESADERDLAQKMINGETGVATLTLDGVEVYAAYAPLSVLDWSICTVIDVKEILEPALINAQGISEMTTTAVSNIDSSITLIMIIFAVVVIVAIFSMTVIAASFANRLTKPIVDLTKSVYHISDGNLEYKSNIRTGDEIEILSDTFETMTHKLTEYISNITKITAEKERMSAELDVAAKIQTSELPSGFPLYPDRHDFDVYASMHPAKEVGGDFYDIFLVDDDHLAVLMADVSGKGVPAAMFMMTAKTLIKYNSMQGKTPAEVFTAVNAQLCDHNKAEMFITAFMGFLEISTGKFTFVNAGHNPPLIKKANGDFEWLKARAGFVLAGMEGIKYRQAELTLEKGDVFFTYTDGVTEATNDKLELYSDPRLIETLNREDVKNLSMEKLVEYMKINIDEFANGSQQADDITMLALQYEGKE